MTVSQVFYKIYENKFFFYESLIIFFCREKYFSKNISTDGLKFDTNSWFNFSNKGFFLTQN
jgi:hypothetical protein